MYNPVHDVHACVSPFLSFYSTSCRSVNRAVRAVTWRACGFLSGASAQLLPIPADWTMQGEVKSWSDVKLSKDGCDSSACRKVRFLRVIKGEE